MLTSIRSKWQQATGSGTLSEIARFSNKPSDSEPHNPYLAARREWDDRYGDLASRVKKANKIALICAGIALLETPAFIAIALRPPKVIVVAVNSAGQYLGSGTSGTSIAVTEDMKRSTMSEWVSNLRLVTPDGISQRGAIEKVYATISSGSPAQTFVSDFYRQDPPHTRALSRTVHVQVNSVLPTSDRTYEVEWLEITRDLEGRELEQQRWKGAFTFVISSSAPNDDRLTRLNPIGLYITHASWSKVL